MQIDTAAIRSIIAARRLRDDILGPGIGDAGWLLLLELYAAHLAGRPRRVSRLVEDFVAPATVNRWLIALAKRGLLTRRASPYCERGVLVALTDEGAKRLRDYLTVAHRLSPWLS